MLSQFTSETIILPAPQDKPCLFMPLQLLHTSHLNHITYRAYKILSLIYCKHKIPYAVQTFVGKHRNTGWSKSPDPFYRMASPKLMNVRYVMGVTVV
jgi:hypothetical protein